MSQMPPHGFSQTIVGWTAERQTHKTDIRGTLQYSAHGRWDPGSSQCFRSLSRLRKPGRAWAVASTQNRCQLAPGLAGRHTEGNCRCRVEHFSPAIPLQDWPSSHQKLNLVALFFFAALLHETGHFGVIPTETKPCEVKLERSLTT
jgi:hypothetical protein